MQDDQSSSISDLPVDSQQLGCESDLSVAHTFLVMAI